jgi:hypothetical protein
MSSVASVLEEQSPAPMEFDFPRLGCFHPAPNRNAVGCT